MPNWLRDLFNRYCFEATLSLILILSVLARMWQISGFSEDYDEGAHLMQAWLLSQGYVLYGEIFCPLPPLLLQPLAWLFAITGPSTVAARLLELFWAVVGLAALAYLGRKLWNDTVGLLAVTILSLADHYFRLSRISLGNVPALALSLVALCAGVYYFEHGRRGWLALAGVAMALSLLTKPIAIATPLLLIGLIIARRYRVLSPWRQWSRDGLVLIIALAVPFIAVLLMYEPDDMVEQVVYLRYHSEQAETDGIHDNLSLMQEYIADNASLAGLALAGLLPAWPPLQVTTLSRIRRKTGPWLVLAWVGLNLILLLRFESLHSHHLVIMEPPLALAAALGICFAIGFLASLRRPGFMEGVGLIACLVYLNTLPALLDDRLSDKPRGINLSETKDQWQAVSLLQRMTTPDQFVVSDDLAIPFEARRRVPPRLSDPSRVVMQAGYVTDELAIQVAKERRVEAVVLWSERFQKRLPHFTRWVDAHFSQTIIFDDERRIIYLK